MMCQKIIRPDQPWLCTLPSGHEGECVSDSSIYGHRVDQSERTITFEQAALIMNLLGGIESSLHDINENLLTLCECVTNVGDKSEVSAFRTTGQ